jgi:transcriptional regulator with XRE-family HTH domain
LEYLIERVITLSVALKEVPRPNFPTYNGIGRRIQALRKKNGLSLEQVASAVGVSPSTIIGYEHNRREPKLETINKLAFLLNTSTDFILGLTDNSEPKDPPSDILEFLQKEHLSVDGIEVTEAEIRQKLIEQYKMMIMFYKNR